MGSCELTELKQAFAPDGNLGSNAKRLSGSSRPKPQNSDLSTISDSRRRSDEASKAICSQIQLYEPKCQLSDSNQSRAKYLSRASEYKRALAFVKSKAACRKTAVHRRRSSIMARDYSTGLSEGEKRRCVLSSPLTSPLAICT